MSSIPKGTLRNGVRRIIAVAIGCWLVMIAGVVMAQDASNPTSPVPNPATEAAQPATPPSIEPVPANAPSPASKATSADAAGGAKGASDGAADGLGVASRRDEGSDDEEVDMGLPQQPWDYAPYRVQVWLAGDDPRVASSRLGASLREFLDRDFSSLWKLAIGDAPTAVAIAAARDMKSLDYETLTAADAVIAVKRNHPEAPRIRFASDVGTHVKETLSTQDRIAGVLGRAKGVGDPELGGATKTFKPISGDALALIESWKDPQAEALLIDRGTAKGLRDPDAKILSLPLGDMVTETIDKNDKLFIVHVESARLPWVISVVEIECLMRSFSSVHRVECNDPAFLAAAVGRAITEAFAPTVRIEDAGLKNAEGLVRGFGLITDEKSPGLVKVNDFFVPMIRKNDRNGDPIAIGPLDWAYLQAKELNGARVKMDFHAGKSGSLQGRQNKRTFRTATRVRPIGDATVIRLHAQRDPDSPLVGYEFYERAIDSKEMTFVGRADWDGRIRIEKGNFPLRLLYVKNGGAVLAKLPVIPGQSELEVADLIGDDQRLRAEAYIRGTQKAIIDLVAIRQLFAARIRKRLEQGKAAEARGLLDLLRNEPTYEKIADDMGRKLVQFEGRNPGEQARINQMFAQTREMLVKNINDQLIRDLEVAVVAGEAGKPIPSPESAAAAPPAAANNPAPANTPAPASAAPTTTPAAPAAAATAPPSTASSPPATAPAATEPLPPSSPATISSQTSGNP
jgi:hypothetical protein